MNRMAHYFTKKSTDELDGEDTSHAADLGRRAAELVKAGYLTPGFQSQMTMDEIEKAIISAESRKREDDLLVDISDFQLCKRFGVSL